MLFMFFGCGSDDNNASNSCKVYLETDAIRSELVQEKSGGYVDGVVEVVYTSKETFENDYVNAFGDNDLLSIDFTKNALVWITVGPGSSSGDITCFQAAQIDNVLEIHYAYKYPSGVINADYNYQTYIYEISVVDKNTTATFIRH